MSSRKPPGYKSANVRRATLVNVVESARLLHTLRCIEQAKVHQCRLTNREIRLTLMSINSIQSCSGYSLNGIHSQQDRRVKGGDKAIDNNGKVPCFMYGERIWSRRRKRLQRSTSALELDTSEFSSNKIDDKSTLFFGLFSGRPKQRPMSVSTLTKPEHRPFSMSTLDYPNRRPLNVSTMEDPKRRTLSMSTLADPKQRPLSVSTLADPKRKPIRMSTLDDPNRKPISMSTLDDPKRRPLSVSTLDDPKRRPLSVSTLVDPKRRPLSVSTLDDPKRKPISMSTLDDPKRKPISMSTLDDPKRRPLSVSTLDDPKRRPLSVSTLDDPKRRPLSVSSTLDETQHRSLSVPTLDELKHRPLSVSMQSERNQRPMSAYKLRTSLASAKKQNTTERSESEQYLPSKNGASTPTSYVTPHQVWEDDVSEMTKKIISTQSRVQSNKRRSVYESSVEVMSSHASRTVRSLLRQIRITRTFVG